MDASHDQRSEPAFEQVVKEGGDTCTGTSSGSTTTVLLVDSQIEPDAKKRARAPIDDKISANTNEDTTKKMRGSDDSSGTCHAPEDPAKLEKTNQTSAAMAPSHLELDPKKRPRSTLKGELPVPPKANKKLHSLDPMASVATGDALLKQEDTVSNLASLPDTAAMPSDASVEPAEDGSAKGLSPTVQSPLKSVEVPSKDLRTPSRKDVPSTRQVAGGEGVFDDADEDEPVDISVNKTSHPPPISPSTSLRPDLIAAILGPRPTPSPRKLTSTQPAVASPVSAAKPRQKKRKGPSKKVFKGQKEEIAAVRLLDEKVDLMGVLPEKDCRFLAEKMWIVTVQQLEAVINATEGEELGFRNELIDSILASDFLNGSDILVASSPIASSKNYPVTNNQEEDQLKSHCDSVVSSGSPPLEHKVASPPEKACRQLQTPDGMMELDHADIPITAPYGPNVSASSSKVPDALDPLSEKTTLQEKAHSTDASSSSRGVPEVADTILGDSDPAGEKSDPQQTALEQSHSQAHGCISREDAEKLLESWSRKLQTRGPSNEPSGEMNRFLLQGALSCFIPRCTLNFLASVNIQTALDFLSLRRTETGIAVDLYISWRKYCGLKDATTFTIAKHLLSIGTRLEVAISSTSCPNKYVREWVGGHTGILSGQAKDFLFDHCKIFDCSFVDRRTKELANVLEDWRASKGLPPLKGTGKVAMISAWKTLIKEAVDFERDEGRVLKDEDSLKVVESEYQAVDPKSSVTTETSTTKKAQPVASGTNATKQAHPFFLQPFASDTFSSKTSQTSAVATSTIKIAQPGEPEKSMKGKDERGVSRRPVLTPKLQAALESKELLVHAFKKKETVNVLASVGITTAKELLATDKSPNSEIVQAIINMRKANSGDLGGSIEPNSCVRLVYDWCRRIKAVLAEIESTDPDAVKVRPGEKTVITAIGAKSLSVDRKFADPYDALSEMARNFLGSIGITDAEGFLGSKTKYLAGAFEKFREENNMPVLKGLGTVASISGWKAIVRKFAAENGQNQLVNLNAGHNTGIRLKRRGSKTDTSVDRPLPLPQANPQAKNSPAKPQVMPEECFGGSKTTFCVGKDEEVFLFELTSRKCSYDESKDSPYLTYLGSMRTGTSNVNIRGSSLSNRHQESVHTVPVLEHVPTVSSVLASGKKPFSSQEIGLIELGRYGVSQSPSKEILASIKRVLKSFIFQDDHIHSLDECQQWNVFERLVDGVKELFFYITKPLEKGQTTELHFLPSAPQVLSGRDFKEEQRDWIIDKVDMLNAHDLRALLDFLNDEVGDIVYPEMSKLFKTEDVKSPMDSKVLADLALARRRMHWVALRINFALENGPNTTILPKNAHVALTPLWTKDVTCYMRAHPAWLFIHPLLVSECKKEMMAEFRSAKFGGFWTSQDMWCPMAESLFRDTVRLFSHYNAELEGFCSEEQLFVDLVALVSGAVTKLRRCGIGKIYDQKLIAELCFKCKGDTSHVSNVFPPVEFLKANFNRGYCDSMALCGEPRFEQENLDEFVLLATSSGSGRECINGATPDFRRFEDALAAGSKIDVPWYVRTQVLAVVESAVSCGVAESAPIGSSKLQDIREKIRKSAKETLGEEIAPFILERRPTNRAGERVAVPRVHPSSTVSSDYKPNAEPLFLGTVWPVLKREKWKLGAGERPSSVIYFPPGKRKDNQTRMLKQEAARERGTHARRTTELGFGYIPKQAKRMFVKCADDKGKDSTSEKITVAEALRNFEQSFDDSGKVNVKDSVKEIVGHIATLFENVAPALLYDTEAEFIKREDGAQWKDTLTCDHLMRLLLILPKMLNNSEVTLQHVESTSGVVIELISFLVQNRQRLFAQPLQLDREEYETTHEFPKFIFAHLAEAHQMDSTSKPENTSMPINLREIVLPSDRNDLTDFVQFVMDQLIAYKATNDDLRRKGRRAFLTMGLPGLVCRHCLGSAGEGKYFYSNMASLSTAPTSVDKHINRCPMISREVKQSMAAARATHAEQRIKLGHGTQSAFFLRLWDRLQHSRISAGAEADTDVILDQTHIAPRPDQDPQQNSACSNDSTEFRNHVQVLEYVQNTSPWRTNPELVAAMESYYSCLRWGGSIFNTTHMPPNFNSEWILAKLCYGKVNEIRQKDDGA